VWSGCFCASSTQFLQQRNTGCPLRTTLTGTPMEPRGSPVLGQKPCAPASWRSSALSFASAAFTVASVDSPPAVSLTAGGSKPFAGAVFAFLFSSSTLVSVSCGRDKALLTHALQHK